MNKIAEKNDALDAFIANYCIDHPLSGSVPFGTEADVIFDGKLNTVKSGFHVFEKPL